MDDRQATTHAVLLKLDPELAGLFHRGCELLTRYEEPGVRYLIAHCSRELGKSIITVLAREWTDSAESGREDGESPPSVDRDALAILLGWDSADDRIDRVLDMRGETQRANIARALRLPQSHPTVRMWAQLQKGFPSLAHYRGDRAPPSAEKARDGFVRLSNLLFARIGPYFEARHELDALLSIGDPQTEHLERLRPLLAHPQLRSRFFGELQHPKWLERLDEAGDLGLPPEWRANPNGTFQSVAWPEGECLARLANAVPELTIRRLKAVPDTLSNPGVWRIVAEAITQLPPSRGAALVPKLKTGLVQAPYPFVTYRAIAAAEHLAVECPKQALALLSILTELRSPFTGSDRTEEEILAFSSEHLLKRIRRFELDEALEKVVPRLGVSAPLDTWRLLLGRLRETGSIVAAAGMDDSELTDQWCPSIEGGPRYPDDLRAALARSALSTARRAIANGPHSATSFLQTFNENDRGLTERLRLLLLQDAGPDLQSAVDAVFTDPDFLQPRGTGAETAALLRRRFPTASQAARRALIGSLERGPGEPIIEAILSRREESGDPAADRERAIADWQAKRLRWFHDVIPAELVDLAARLRVQPAIPTSQQQALDEVGWWTSGVYSGRDISPVEATTLATMPDEELLTLLATWQPSGPDPNLPSVAGLQNAFAAFLGDHFVERASLIGRLVTEAELSDRYLGVVLEVAAASLKNDREIPWTEVLEICKTALNLSPVNDDRRLGSMRRSSRNGAVRFLEHCLGRDGTPESVRPTVLSLVEAAVRTSPAWAPPEPPSTYREINDSVWSSDAGGTTELVARVVHWNLYLTQHGQASLFPQGSNSTTELLDFIREREDPGGVFGRAMLGTWLWIFAIGEPEWLRTRAESLLAQGMTSPARHPTWGRYLAHPLRRDAYLLLLPWYARLVEDLPRLVELENGAGGSEDSRISRKLAEHAIQAFIWGDLDLSNHDGWFERTVNGVDVEDRAHTYGWLYRGLSDSKDPLEEGIEARLIRLWDWRLNTLESDPTAAGVSVEADSLAFLGMIDALPARHVLPLALRTVSLVGRGVRTVGMWWSHLSRLAIEDLPATIQLAGAIVQAELRSEYPYFMEADVAPVLRLGLASADSAVQRSTRDIIHVLGSAGFENFGELLRG